MLDVYLYWFLFVYVFRINMFDIMTATIAYKSVCDLCDYKYET